MDPLDPPANPGCRSGGQQHAIAVVAAQQQQPRRHLLQERSGLPLGPAAQPLPATPFVGWFQRGSEPEAPASWQVGPGNQVDSAMHHGPRPAPQVIYLSRSGVVKWQFHLQGLAKNLLHRLGDPEGLLARSWGMAQTGVPMLKETIREGAKLKRRHHPPRTPQERLLALSQLRDAQRKALEELQRSSDPVALLETVRRCQASLASLSSGQDNQE